VKTGNLQRHSFSNPTNKGWCYSGRIIEGILF